MNFTLSNCNNTTNKTARFLHRTAQIVEKVCFYKTRSKSSIPIRTLCGLCILQSLRAFYLGIHAGAECGAAALTPLGATPQTPFSKIYRFFGRLRGGYSPPLILKNEKLRLPCGRISKFLIPPCKTVSCS